MDSGHAEGYASDSGHRFPPRLTATSGDFKGALPLQQAPQSCDFLPSGLYRRHRDFTDSASAESARTKVRGL